LTLVLNVLTANAIEMLHKVRDAMNTVNSVYKHEHSNEYV